MTHEEQRIKQWLDKIIICSNNVSSISEEELKQRLSIIHESAQNALSYIRR